MYTPNNIFDHKDKELISADGHTITAKLDGRGQWFIEELGGARMVHTVDVFTTCRYLNDAEAKTAEATRICPLWPPKASG